MFLDGSNSNLFYMEDVKEVTNKKDSMKRDKSHNSLQFCFTKQNEEDEPYDYHAKLIEVLSNCTTGKESFAFAETKLRAVLPINYIFKLLMMDDKLDQGV
jgi:hypothetical protein